MVRKLFYCNGLRDNRKEDRRVLLHESHFATSRGATIPTPAGPGHPEFKAGRQVPLEGGVSGKRERRPLRETSLSSGGSPQG